jgi:hypothetical protein
MSQSYQQYGGNPYGGGANYEQGQQGAGYGQQGGGYSGGGYNQSGNPYASTVSIAYDEINS